MLAPIEIRRKARKPRIWVAVRGGKCEPTVRAYELNREGVSEDTREALDPVYAEMASALEGQA